MALIALDQVGRVFNRSTIKELARLAKLQADADLIHFGESVRIAVDLFIRSKTRLSGPQIRTEIERLYRRNTLAERGGDRAAHQLADALDTMSDDVRTWLTSRNAPHNRAIPTAAEIRSLATRDAAVERLRLVLSYGGRVVAGRHRPTGRRSRTFEPLLRAPAIMKRGRPAGSADREFLQGLSLAYLEASGHLQEEQQKPPPFTANYDAVIRGPFSRFVHRCFELVGARTGNVTRLINQYGGLRRLAAKGARPKK
jgi:hypothetical protein